MRFLSRCSFVCIRELEANLCEGKFDVVDSLKRLEPFDGSVRLVRGPESDPTQLKASFVIKE